MAKPPIMFFHDSRHPLIYMYEPPMQKEEMEAAVDELAGTPVEALMFCLGDGRTVLHDTRVGELWGHNVKRWPHLVFQRAHRNAAGMIGRGLDPLRVVCERARAKGMLLYPTLLVQQGRGPREQDVRCSEFRFASQHLEIGARSDLPPDFPGATCLDFIHEEVREERFALIQEVLDQYPVDGFELQLNYQPHYFHPANLAQGRKLMTAWIERVYRAVKRSGKERELVIRVPSSIEGCLEVGLDVREWLRRGIADVLVGQNFSGPELLDQMADFRPLVAAAKDSGCRVLAAIQSLVDSDRLGDASIEMIRAGACNYWAQGVDGLYLAHWFGSWPYQAPFYEKLRELPHPEVMAPKDKTYFIPTETGRYPTPIREPGLEMVLPAPLTLNQPVQLPLHISDDLPRWQRVGRVHQVLLRVRVMGLTERHRLRFRLNRKILPLESARLINEIYRMKAPRYRTGSGYWFVFRLDRNRWPRQGENLLEITLLKGDRQALPEVRVRDVEMEIRYLLGRNFNRGQDPDLGPWENAVSFR
ncbi:MAG: hypothetical protein HYW07_20320 [Candidatus Latescibacteria bacterium]|nr:hypothetical protein [Candidatus Latescibacterota bacterium]